MINIHEGIKSFLTHCQYEKGLSENTLKFYKIDLNQFTNFLCIQKYTINVIEIDKEILRQYIQNLSKLKPKSLKRKIATLKVLFNYLEFEDILLINPFRKLRIKIKEEKRLPNALSLLEIKGIFTTAYKNLTNDKNSKLQLNYYYRDIAILELLFATGIRVSELVSLKINDINFKLGTIRVIGKGNKERLLYVGNKETIVALETYSKFYFDLIKSSGGYFFINRVGSQLSTQSVRGIVKNYRFKAGIEKRVTPHMFRHTFATLLLENDVDIKYIQSFLGHSSIITTQIYTQVNRVKQEQILSTKHPRNNFSIKCPR